MAILWLHKKLSQTCGFKKIQVIDFAYKESSLCLLQTVARLPARAAVSSTAQLDKDVFAAHSCYWQNSFAQGFSFLVGCQLEAPSIPCHTALPLIPNPSLLCSLLDRPTNSEGSCWGRKSDFNRKASRPRRQQTQKTIWPQSEPRFLLYRARGGATVAP